MTLAFKASKGKSASKILDEINNTKKEDLKVPYETGMESKHETILIYSDGSRVIIRNNEVFIN